MLGYLVATAGPDVGQKFAVGEGQTRSLGRGEQSHTELRDPRVSRWHCVWADCAGYRRLDQGAAGGRFVNGAPLTEHALKPGGVVRSDGQVDCRADIHNFGDTLYALLTGRPPFEGDSLPQVIAKIRNEQPVKPKSYRLAISDMFQDVVMQMLAKRPDDGYEKPGLLL